METGVVNQTLDDFSRILRNIDPNCEGKSFDWRREAIQRLKEFNIPDSLCSTDRCKLLCDIARYILLSSLRLGHNLEDVYHCIFKANDWKIKGDLFATETRNFVQQPNAVTSPQPATNTETGWLNHLNQQFRESCHVNSTSQAGTASQIANDQTRDENHQNVALASVPNTAPVPGDQQLNETGHVHPTPSAAPPPLTPNNLTSQNVESDPALFHNFRTESAPSMGNQYAHEHGTINQNSSSPVPRQQHSVQNIAEQTLTEPESFDEWFAREVQTEEIEARSFPSAFYNEWGTPKNFNTGYGTPREFNSDWYSPRGEPNVELTAPMQTPTDGQYFNLSPPMLDPQAAGENVSNEVVEEQIGTISCDSQTTGLTDFHSNTQQPEQLTPNFIHSHQNASFPSPVSPFPHTNPEDMAVPPTLTAEIATPVTNQVQWDSQDQRKFFAMPAAMHHSPYPVQPPQKNIRKPRFYHLPPGTPSEFGGVIPCHCTDHVDNPCKFDIAICKCPRHFGKPCKWYKAHPEDVSNKLGRPKILPRANALRHANGSITPIRPILSLPSSGK